MGKQVITEVKPVSDKIAFIYEYTDGKTGELNEKIVILDANIPAKRLEHIEPTLECNFGPNSKPRLIMKELVTVKVTINEY